MYKSFIVILNYQVLGTTHNVYVLSFYVELAAVCYLHEHHQKHLDSAWCYKVTTAMTSLSHRNFSALVNHYFMYKI